MSEAASALTQFLVKRGSGYDSTSPIEREVQVQITRMMNTMARDMIDSMPELRDAIGERLRQVIAQALRDDAWLSESITKAVAQALTGLAIQRAASDD
jgi:hypothetical protein